MLTFLDLQGEVKRRATLDQGGTQFDTAIKNIINMSLFRVGREAGWRSMRKRTTFDTAQEYSTGSGSGVYTSGSNLISVTGANFITAGIKVGQRIKLSGDSRYHTIKGIPSSTGVNIEVNYYASSVTTGTYEILGQEEYNLPIQAGHRMFMWHEEYGYPYKMIYVTDQDFYDRGFINTTKGVPTHYRMWGEDMIINQLATASNITIYSSETGDTSKDIMIFGTVSSYPDYETVTTNASNGTTAATSTKKFTYVERIVKDASTTGRITVTATNIAIVAVLPVGDTTAGILYKKVQLYPLPDTVFPINVHYYKDPFRLVNDDDVHELGQDFDEAIILLSVAKLKAQQEQKEAAGFISLYKDEINNLRKVNIDKIDFFPTLRRPYQSNNDMVTRNLSYKQVGSQYGPRSRY